MLFFVISEKSKKILDVYHKITSLKIQNRFNFLPEMPTKDGDDKSMIPYTGSVYRTRKINKIKTKYGGGIRYEFRVTG